MWTNSLYTIDSWVIMKGSPNKAQAEQYIQLRQRLPENQKNLPTKITYGVTTKAATNDDRSKAILPNLPTAPENIATALYIDEHVLGREHRQAQPALQRVGCAIT